MLGIRTADSEPSEQVGLVYAGVDVASAVERLANLDAAIDDNSARAASMSETI